MILFIAVIHLLKAQEYPPPTDLISVPTAGTLMRGSFSMDMRIQDEGGLILGLSAGITAVSYTHLTLPTNREV